MTTKAYMIPILVLLAACGGDPSNPPQDAGAGGDSTMSGDCGVAGSGGSTASGCASHADCSQPTDARCSAGFCVDGACSTLPFPKGSACGTGMECDGAGLCVVPPFHCKGSADCDDGNPCTIDVCTSFDGTCSHVGEYGGTPCPGGYCLDGQGVCCAGCNSDGACVAACDSGQECLFGFCMP